MREGRWYIVWRYSAPDPLSWIGMVAGTFLLVFSVADGWAFGAALSGWFVGSMSVWWAFISNHFRMSDSGGSDQR